MPKGKVFWRNNELFITWEKMKAGKTSFVQPMPVKDSSAIAAMKQMPGVAEADVEVELVSGAPGRITFVSSELSVKAEEDAQEKARRQEEQRKKAQERQRAAEKNNREESEDEMKREFHNPYNFVPAVPRDHIDGNTNDLGDREPSGHDRYLADKYSGKLHVRMRVETPLLLPDTARVGVGEIGDSDHKSFPVRVGADGKPEINPTAIKGMLRSAYEAITNSRLSVFNDHDERLAFRGEAKTPAAARIEMHNGSLHIRKFDTAAVLVRYRKHWNGEKDKLEKADTRRTLPEPGRAMKFSSSSDLPAHGEPVWVRVSPRIAMRGPRKGQRIGTKVDEIRPRAPGSAAPTGFVEGWACITGANAKDKVYERVFIDPLPNPVPVTDSHKKLWKELVSNYQKTHEEDLKKRGNKRPSQKPTDYLGNNPGETAWSRHIYNSTDLQLEEGTLCYLVEEGNTIKGLLPVMISRRLYETSPESLLPDSLKPSQNVNKLSPADRVFGWVRQGKGASKEGAYRGQVRIGVVDCVSDKADAIESFATALPLQILGQPKPQQGRFYVARDQSGQAQGDGLKTQEAGFQASNGLRGRKVYPHHNNLPEDYWTDPINVNLTTAKADQGFYKEYRRPQKDEQEQRDNQNRSIKGWVKKGAIFEFDLHFLNLSDAELGALLWLLKLNSDGENKYFHRFGGGKPLGFGSVRLELVTKIQKEGQDTLVSDIRTGAELKESRYGSLGSDSMYCDPQRLKTCVEAFQKAVATMGGSHFEEAKFIKAFLRAAQGFDDNKPIHYPRTREQGTSEYPPPNPVGESFKWFVENSRTETRTNQATNQKYAVAKYGFALPDLSNEIGLPILEQEPERSQQGNWQGQKRDQKGQRDHGHAGNRNRR
jgi:CRISPR-associated protein (TIGR03986 family)